MNQITAADRSILSKLLGLIGSSHDAEALAAARKAHALVRARGATWPAVLGLDDISPEPEHVALGRDLLAKGKGTITTWEMRFLRGILAFKALSAQQRQILDGIAAKVFATMENGQPTD